MQLKEHFSRIDTETTHEFKGSKSSMHVKVKILDVRQNYGRVEYLITPIQGSGAIWVQIKES